ncbi:acyloxyacyl hydrolase-like [Mizuhopecten yessoensis]|uniref:acyloxyacyl hydrolase-like n=1 Tax=Mizuhopecten yessoensis TaxID=6573 RepID=UPI000B45EBC7|nr:acyloxyacyl hydrolase-like [Mizuhopecten yessoensis]
MLDRVLLLSVFLLLCFATSPTSSTVVGDFMIRGRNGGVSCATCTVIMGLTEQLSVIHNETIIHSLERLCNYLPDKYRQQCQIFTEFFGSILIARFTKDDNPDTVCRKIRFCYTEPDKQECHIFPKSKSTVKRSPRNIHSGILKEVLSYEMKQAPYKIHQDPKICELPGIKTICNWIDMIFDKHDPAIDLDDDRYSTYKTLRGSSWRGKDCDDGRKDIHPGSRPIQSDGDKDSNCNGIMGVDPVSGQPYEDLYCKDSQARGVVVLGDSISAHFHIPREWLNSTEISAVVFEPLPFILENEFDWPELSSITGYMNNTYTNVNHGPMNSVYDYLWQRNRCNHRDYQNIAVNGARSGSMVDEIEKSLFRNQTTDNPVTLFYALVGNDVCNGHPDTFAHMTTPEEMKNNSIRTLQFLEKALPAGSHVFFVGLADGRVLFEGLKDRIHPIGSLRNDVTYSNFYDYFNCLEISPCLGWMNTNETVRNMTTQRAEQLSNVLKEVALTEAAKYHNFKLAYVENPIFQVVEYWKKLGRPLWELIEPVDGFHTNQLGQALTGQVLWQNLETEYPDAIGPINPFNTKIKTIFGDQGGY